MTMQENKRAFMQAFTRGITGGVTRQAAESIYALAEQARKGENIMDGTIEVVCEKCIAPILAVRGDTAARCPVCGYSFAVPEPGHECGDVRTGTDG